MVYSSGNGGSFEEGMVRSKGNRLQHSASRLQMTRFDVSMSFSSQCFSRFSREI
jgi:hypothetical protein